MDAQSLRGLTEDEAARRLASIGPNQLPRPGPRTLLRIIIETAREPMFLLMMGAAALYLVLGDMGEGAFLLAGAMASVGLVIAQEARSERALSALRDLAQPHIRVIRDGVERALPSRDLVPGDILLIGEGERVPADGLLAGGDVLSLDESALTGESAPVSKTHAKPGEDFDDLIEPGAEAGPHLFAGSLVVRGQGVVLVARTGARSALGRIGRSLAEIEQEPTPLQKTAGRLVGILGGVALGFCALVAVAYGLLRHDWVGGALSGITVAIALVPEEFPMVLAVFMALGAWRLATHNVLTRRSAVIEALGGATVLCVDKTGTLTENRMEVARLWTAAGDVAPKPGQPLDEASAALLGLAALASAVRPIDPMDKAVRALQAAAIPARGGPAGEPERVWPLRRELMAVVQIWRGGGEMRIAAAKGAPEAIFRLCALPAVEIERLHLVIEGMAGQGLRVLGVASADAPGRFDQAPETTVFRFAGLVGFIDPLRAGVPASIGEARAAGISVLMITGDHPATARAIAQAAGIDTAAGVMLGSELAGLSFEVLCERLRTVRVFARIVPEQKLQIVQALKADGEVVAMTGDGVNDAPALEAAHIGVAMGLRGTDVAREAADLVLLDDSFSSIVGGVRLGRRIFTNLRRALVYITAIHVPIAGLALAPVLLGLPPLLFPMHVVLMELAIDPICALAFEAERSESAAMNRPPRRIDEPLFGARQLVLALVQGAGILAAVLGLYIWALGVYPAPVARGGAFSVLVLGNLVLALADSSATGRIISRERLSFALIATAIVSALAVVLTVPAAATLFGVARPDARLIAIAVLVALVAGGWTRLMARTGGARVVMD